MLHCLRRAGLLSLACCLFCLPFLFNLRSTTTCLRRSFFAFPDASSGLVLLRASLGEPLAGFQGF